MRYTPTTYYDAGAQASTLCPSGWKSDSGHSGGLYCVDRTSGDYNWYYAETAYGTVIRFKKGNSNGSEYTDESFDLRRFWSGDFNSGLE